MGLPPSQQDSSAVLLEVVSPQTLLAVVFGRIREKYGLASQEVFMLGKIAQCAWRDLGEEWLVLQNSSL